MGWPNNRWGDLRGADALSLRTIFTSLTEYLSGPSQYISVPLRTTLGLWAIPNAAAEESQGFRSYADLSGFLMVKFTCFVYGAGFNGAKLRLQYTTDLTGAGGWSAVDTSTDLAVNAAGPQLSAWVSVPSLARTEVLLRYVGLGGDGATNNSIGNVAAWLRP